MEILAAAGFVLSAYFYFANFRQTKKNAYLQVLKRKNEELRRQMEKLGGGIEHINMIMQLLDDMKWQEIFERSLDRFYQFEDLKIREKLENSFDELRVMIPLIRKHIEYVILESCFVFEHTLQVKGWELFNWNWQVFNEILTLDIIYSDTQISKSWMEDMYPDSYHKFTSKLENEDKRRIPEFFKDLRKLIQSSPAFSIARNKASILLDTLSQALKEYENKKASWKEEIEEIEREIERVKGPWFLPLC